MQTCMQNLKIMRDGKRPAVGKQWLVGGAAAKIPTPLPPEGGGSESVHEDRSSKKTGRNCCCISARHGSVNQQLLKRTTLEEWCKHGSAGKPLQVLRLLLATRRHQVPGKHASPINYVKR